MMRDVLLRKGGRQTQKRNFSLFFNFKTLNLNTLNESVVNNAFFFSFFWELFFLCPSDDDDAKNSETSS